jgi:alpha-glucosidase (family GH31 glycosyl hydrolase)
MRWVQFGMFSPLAMVFGMDHPGYKEPWNYGEEALANFRKYDSLRYRLLPYIYSSAWEMYKTGMPIMRALVLDYQDDENVYEIGDQYMFGKNIMVCPVTTKGAQTRTVYLPYGKWIDYWTGQEYNGKQYIHIVTPPDVLPLFVKAGAIIPMQPAMNYTGEKPVDPVTLDLYPGSKSEFKLYEDDGQSLDYLNGKHCITGISLQSGDKMTHVLLTKYEAGYTPPTRTFALRLHSSVKPKTIRVNQQMIQENNGISGWNFNATKKVINLKVSSGLLSPISIVIDY